MPEPARKRLPGLPSTTRTSLICWLALIVVISPAILAQSDNATAAPAVDVLGAHAIAGRGCVSCHAPHNGAASVKETLNDALWGVSGIPDYGPQVTIPGRKGMMELVPGNFITGDAEVSGVVLCLSCHDGNITPQNMLAGRSYEVRMGLLPFVRSQPLPTLLGEDQPASIAIDHPMGQGATISQGDGLEFADGKFSVRPGSAYARFVQSYGWPSLAPLQRSAPYGVDREGQPYLVCTTCHDQHAMNLYASRADDPIAGDTSGRYYTTFFFVNGPYNPGITRAAERNATSGMQFCRQCHFNIANEGNNSDFIPTLFF